MSKGSSSADTQSQTARLDKWLWAARFFKTRSMASNAIKGGKVKLDGHNTKPSATLKTGQRLEVTKGEQAFEVIVEAISEQRGPASQAQNLYTETQVSREKREQSAAERRAARLTMPKPARKPDKRQRRRLREFKFNQG